MNNAFFKLKLNELLKWELLWCQIYNTAMFECNIFTETSEELLGLLLLLTWCSFKPQSICHVEGSGVTRPKHHTVMCNNRPVCF